MVAVIIAVALFVLAPILGMLGAPVQLVGALSVVSLLVLAVTFIALVVVPSGQLRWLPTLALIAVGTQVAAALLLLVREPEPTSEFAWAWYWPVVNTLYFGGILVAFVAIFSAAVGFVMTRTGSTAAALALAVAAVAVNRLAPYR
jgi:hypothetical protein